ncbi:hypothetical protein LTR66_007768 [Elasticomyces elasticus]|nr:hypothetical protein LTR66_007768 [Elasticomyces elasticus]
MASPSGNNQRSPFTVEAFEPGAIGDDMSYERRLFQYTINSGQTKPHFLIFRGLQRLNMIRLQNDLAICKRAIWEKQEAPESETIKLTYLLHNYADAIRDYEYLSKLIPVTGSQAKVGRFNLEQAFIEIGDSTDEPAGYRRFSDSSLLLSDPLRDVLKRELPRTVTYTKAEMERRTDEYFAREPPEEVSPFVDRLARFIIAFVGGSVLVVPMLVMRLPRVGLAKSLITASIAVVLFSGALSIGLKASNTETLVATATYAAVLVVFVGTSS